MQKQSILRTLGSLTWILATVSILSAQELVPPATTPTDPGPVIAPTDTPPAPDPAPQNPDSTPDWYLRRANPSGNNVHISQQQTTPDGTTVNRDHTVINPQGTKTQTWQRTTTADGTQWQRQQTWTSPDGTVQRQHTWNGTATDPYNGTRQQTIMQSPDRTLTRSQTRTWDGTTGSVQRTFTGPNGQTRTQEHPWSPDGTTTDPSQTPVVLQTPPADAPVPDTTQQPSQASSKPADKKTLLERMKAWNTGRKASADESKSTPRRGFTVGSMGAPDTVAANKAQLQQPTTTGQKQGFGEALRHRWQENHPQGHSVDHAPSPRAGRND